VSRASCPRVSRASCPRVSRASCPRVSRASCPRVSRASRPPRRWGFVPSGLRPSLPTHLSFVSLTWSSLPLRGFAWTMPPANMAGQASHATRCPRDVFIHYLSLPSLHEKAPARGRRGFPYRLRVWLNASRTGTFCGRPSGRTSYARSSARRESAGPCRAGGTPSAARPLPAPSPGRA